MHRVLKTWATASSHKKILLLRHGNIENETNEKRFIGQTDVPLSDSGRRQARHWRDCLAESPPTAVISSDLRRCLETARIIAADHCMDATPRTELREILLGKWEGRTFRRIRERWPDAFQQRGMDLARFRPPGGESFLDLQQRVIPVFEQVVQQSGRRVLIVAHAGVNRVILCHLLGMPLKNLFRIAQGCGVMNLIDCRESGYRISALNLSPVPCGH